MTKVISLSNDVYEALTNLKGVNSYSSIIRDLLNARANKEKILNLAGKGIFDESNLLDLKKGWKKWSEKSV